MVLYFSGTGNSRYVARRIAEALHEPLFSINDRVKANDTAPVPTGRQLIVVSPTYGWRLPRVVRDWLLQTEFPKVEQVWFVMTCGSEIGNAGSYAEKWCRGKGFDFKGCAGVVMPENYIAMFKAPSPKEEAEIIVRANGRLDALAQSIAKGESFTRPQIKLMDRIYSGIVNGAFYPMFVKSRKFRTTDECIGCGKCAVLCPTKSIRIEGGRPVWGDGCTHCMACICRCPKQAIEYGRHTMGLRRYYLDG